MSDPAIRTRAPITSASTQPPVEDPPSGSSSRARVGDTAAQARPVGLEEIFGGDIASCRPGTPDRLDFGVQFATARAVDNGFSFVDAIKLRNYDAAKVEKILRHADPTGELGLVNKWHAYQQLSERLAGHVGDDGKVDRSEYADLAQRAEELGIPQSELREAVDHLEKSSRRVPDLPRMLPRTLPRVGPLPPQLRPMPFYPCPHQGAPELRPMPFTPTPGPLPPGLLIPLGSEKP